MPDILTTMPQVLSWLSGEAVFQQIHDTYVDLLSDTLGQFLAQLTPIDSLLTQRVLNATRTASDEEFLRLLTAPETSHRLFHQRGPESLQRVGQFLERSFQSETARSGQIVKFEQETWTALGDQGFFPDGSQRKMPVLPGLMPLDFGSPYWMKTGLLAADNHNITPIPDFDATEENLILQRLAKAHQYIQQTSPLIANFVSRFNKVLIIQKNIQLPQCFGSGSHHNFIGKSCMMNPQAASVNEVEIADAMVHEAIHGLLDMQERRRHWFLDYSLYRLAANVESPWSGKSLTLSSFFQACFVWYGLLNFWSLACQAKSFDSKQTQAQIYRALQGFLKGSLIDRVSSYLDAIQPELKQTIQEMQTNVTEAFATTI